MALTLNTVPDRISNIASFNVTTTLVEDSSHVNLRIRADIYHEGIIKATSEKPKGIDDFDFIDILKSLVPGLKIAKDTGDVSNTGTVGSNLITSWASRSGTYTTLTTVGNIISSAICTVSSSLETNAISMTVGDIYVFYVPNMVNSGSVLGFELESGGGGALSESVILNKGIIVMPTASGNFKLTMGFVGTQNFSGTFYCYKITTNRSTIGGILTSYFVNFSEIYEDSVGVTTTGATSKSKLYRFVPAKGDTSAFSEYVLHNGSSMFACKTLKAGAVRFYTSASVDYEYSLCYFTEFVELQLFQSKDNAAYTSPTQPYCYEGWGVVILNIGEIMSAVTSNLRLYLIERGTPTTITEVLTTYIDTSIIDERVVLEYDGQVGGKEYLAFEGKKDVNHVTERTYYKSSEKISKLLKAYGKTRQVLETRFTDINNASYLSSLLDSDVVKKLLANYEVPKDVTVLTESVKTSSSELFTNPIEIEY